MTEKKSTEHETSSEDPFLEESLTEEIYDKAKALSLKDSVYLSGPIRCVEDDGRGWRNKVIDEYDDEFTFLNPLDEHDPENEEIIGNPDNFDTDSEKKQVLPTEYVMDDKRLISQSEFILVGLPDSIARGTMMECMWGYLHQTPLYVWTIDGQDESGWIYEHSEIVSDDLDEVVSEMRV